MSDVGKGGFKMAKTLITHGKDASVDDIVDSIMDELFDEEDQKETEE